MNKQLWSVGAKGGLWGTLFFMIFFGLVYLIYGNPFLPIKSLDFFVYLFAMLAVLVWHRLRMPGGFASRFHLWEGLQITLATGLVMLALSVLFIYGFITWMAPEVVQAYAQYEIQQFVAAKAQWIESFKQDGKDGVAIYEEVYRNYQKRDWVAYLLIQEIAQKSFLGLLLSIIISAVLRK
ncbi:MAG: DUF4199 domain-containing protein [Microscillaceae bacterium]|nr:DUF4199 domain-containing protein [Microscillaceae bacterium]